MNKEKDKKLVNDDKLNLTCIPPDNNRAPNKPKDGVVIDSSYKTFKEPKIENTLLQTYTIILSANYLTLKLLFQPMMQY